MMIWITGDTHGDFHRLSTKHFPEQKQMTHDDYVIILGDFGGVFCGSAEEKYWLNWLNEKNFTTLWIDGNHENFQLLEQYPQIPFHGGQAHQVHSHVFHLCRGHIFRLNQYQFFVMGGAQSHDSLFLSPDSSNFKRRKQKLKRDQIPFRVAGENWWRQELPDTIEFLDALHRLRQEPCLEDCIVLSHCAPSDIQQCLFPDYPINELTDFLMVLRRKLPYQRWYCGHYHQNIELSQERFHILYEQIIRLP